jgi:ankyrin repeat protein
MPPQAVTLRYTRRHSVVMSKPYVRSSRKADPNKAGDTPLHVAASSDFTSIIQLLVDHGANLNAKNEKGQTPLALTTMGGRGARGASPAMKKAEDLLR